MMESGHDPRRPKPGDDDAVPGLPIVDGDTDGTIETGVDLDVDDDEASALDDSAAPELAGIDDEIDEGPATLDDDEAVAPVEADPELADGENERWTEGSDASEDTPWQEPAVAEPTETAIDRGEEGFDDLNAPAGDALPGLPPAHAGEAGDDDADELDVSEAATLETAGTEAENAPELPRATVGTRWHGPSREATRALASADDAVLVAARGLWRITNATTSIAVPFDGEVSAVLFRGGTTWVANDAGDVWRWTLGEPERHARPGTADASVGGLELFEIADVIVARTRGGALFRSSGDAWTGPIVAKNVRRARMGLSADARLVLVVGSATAPELLSTRDARRFERVRAPEGEVVVDASRGGDVVAVACASGRLLVSHDGGASYAAAPGVVDAERVWARSDGVILVGTFHEATDHGRLVRVANGTAEVVLDVDDEIRARRLSGPGELDGDGRVHAVLAHRSALWVATGVGVFELALDLSGGEGQGG